VAQDPRLSALFDRYRREGDLSALAKLFDELSPEMMRVARHVAGRGIDPEDVVQSTFLASIERAEAFDAARPIVPWLMGILINQARLANRRRATRYEEAPSDDVADGAREPEDAEAHEVRDAVARALADLPPTYREVLVAHLAEGKPPHEIARELGRPQGTVRAQLHRGLRLVRRALPAGFAFGALSLVDRTALAAVRREVLTAAARAKDLPASAIPRAVPASQAALKVACAVLVLGGAVAAAWIGGGGSGGHGVTLDETVASRSGGAATGGDSNPGRQVGAVVGAETAPDAADAAPVQTVDALGSVRVLVRDARGEPVPGVRVDLLAWGDPRWHERERTAVTDMEGAAEFVRVQAGRVGVHLDLDVGGPQARADVLAGNRTDLPITLKPGIELTGVVLDRRGVPVAGAVVEAADDPNAKPRRVSELTGPDGRFHLSDVPRALNVWARADARAASETLWLGSPGWSQRGALDVSLVLGEPEPPIEFVVADRRGVPIADALVQGQGVDGGVRFRADGAVVLDGRAARTYSGSNGSVRLCVDRARVQRLSISAPGYARREIDVDEAGSLVTLDHGARLHGVALFPDGSAAEDARIQAWPAGFRSALTTRVNADGSWLLEGVPPGEFLLRAGVTDDAPAVELRGVLNEGGAIEWNPRLQHTPVIRGIARSAHGGPAKTWLVKAVREDEPDSAPLASWARAHVPIQRSRDLRQCWTALDGSFVVPCGATGRYRLELRPRAQWSGPVMGALESVPAGARGVELRVLEPRGWLRARLLDARGLPAVGTLIAVRRGSGAEHRASSGAGGEIVFDLHPGTYELVLWPDGRAPTTLGVHTVDAEQRLELGDLRLAEPGTLVVTATAGAQLELFSAQGLPFQLAPNAEALVARGLPPGSYRLRGRMADGTAYDELVRVDAGLTTTLALAP